MYSASSAFLDALMEHGVSHLFVNLGSDHPALVEALAEARATGRKVPLVITCPNEMAGMSAAHGFWLASGVPQGVIIHVECGTQALAGAVHNADKGRAPMLIFAGASPFTQNGEMRGSRNEFIQWIQDVHDQRGIVRGYMRYDAELKTGKNIKDMVHRAFQFANSDPKGPVYLMGAREVMEEEVAPLPDEAARWRPVAPVGLAPDAARRVAALLNGAEAPLLVTSYVGRNPQAVAPLTALCERLGMGVLDSVQNAVNIAHDHPLYQGCQWNQPVQNRVLAAADAVLVVDSDVPWIPAVSRPREDARIVHIDVDPIKQQMPLWRVAAEEVLRADAATALTQILGALEEIGVDEAKAEARRARYTALHDQRARELAALEERPLKGITSEYVLARLRAMADDSVLYINESISHYHSVFNHLAPRLPGQMHTSGGGSLGWNGGAAFGAKLACPEKTVIAIKGDGSHMFAVPSSVHWMERRYEAPILHIIFNNRGWKSPKLSALAVHPTGYASKANALDTSFDPPVDYVALAAASGGAWGLQIREADQVDAALAEALRQVREEKRSAVLDLWLDHH